MKIGEEFRLFNQTEGEFKVKIVEINKRDLKLVIGDKLREVAREKSLTLGLCIIKPDRFTESVKAATTLGATEIIPIISERTQNRSINHDRITKCIIEATEQSERFAPPILHLPITLEGFCKLESVEQIIFANEEEENVKINSIKGFKDQLAVLIGPEGGFSTKEKEQLMANRKVDSISLGNNVLKSEVAVTALIACVNLMRHQ